MKAVKLVSLAIGGLGTTIGGVYGIGSWFSLFRTYVAEEKVSWESVWILNNGKDKFCRFSDKNSVENDNTRGNRLNSNSCFTYWSHSITRSNSNSKAEWWMRGKSKQDIEAILVGEPFLDTELFDNLVGKSSSTSKQQPSDTAESKSLTFDDLQKGCKVDDKTGSGGWIEIICPKGTN